MRVWTGYRCRVQRGATLGHSDRARLRVNARDTAQFIDLVAAPFAFPFIAQTLQIGWEALQMRGVTMRLGSATYMWSFSDYAAANAAERAKTFHRHPSPFTSVRNAR